MSCSMTISRIRSLSMLQGGIKAETKRKERVRMAGSMHTGGDHFSDKKRSPLDWVCCVRFGTFLEGCRRKETLVVSEEESWRPGSEERRTLYHQPLLCYFGSYSVYVLSFRA